MKKNLLFCVVFAACFSLGFVCGMYAQARIISGDDAASQNAAKYVVTNVGSVKCLDGTSPDINGCCTGEEYTYMIDSDMWACCPADGDCFPPIPMSE